MATFDRRNEPPSAAQTPRGVVAATLAGGVLLVAMVVLLALTLSELRTSRTHIADQDAKVTKLLELSRPALEGVPPLTRDAEPLLDDARPVVGALAQDLPAILTSGETTLDRLPALAVSAQALVSEAFPAVRALGAIEVEPALAAVQALAGQLLEGERLAATLDEARVLMEQIETLGLTVRAARTARRIERLLTTQRRTLKTQRNSLAVQRRSLDVQTETLGHVRSIDEKTGGQAPPLAR